MFFFKGAKWKLKKKIVRVRILRLKRTNTGKNNLKGPIWKKPSNLKNHECNFAYVHKETSQTIFTLACLHLIHCLIPRNSILYNFLIAV
jgi:hypothetical protein